MNERTDKITKEHKPIISYVIPTVRYNSLATKHRGIKLNDDFYYPPTPKQSSLEEKVEKTKAKSRKKRGIIDTLQNVYSYWMNQVLGSGNRRKSNFQKYKIVNGVKYVYYPRVAQKLKQPTQINHVKNVEDNFRPIIIAEDFNKGETVEGPIESRMNRKKFHKMKDTVNDTIEENPWE